MKRFIVIMGEPVGKQRPRFTGYGRTYTPKKTVDYEDYVKWTYVEKYGDFALLKPPISVSIMAEFGIPQSASKKKQAEMEGAPCTKKCDADNIAKIILDALNGIAYADDAGVSTLIVDKTYSSKPKVTVYMEEKNTENN